MRGYEHCQELSSCPSLHWPHGNKINEMVEAEDKEHQTQQQTRDHGNNLHGVLLQLKKIQGFMTTGNQRTALRMRRIFSPQPWDGSTSPVDSSDWEMEGVLHGQRLPFD